MVIAGHKHTYNRMFPISSALTYETQNPSLYINPQSPVYIVSGAAGTQSSPSVSGMFSSPLLCITEHFVSAGNRNF